LGEIAAELRVHPVTVQKLCREGALQPYRVGRSYRIPNLRNLRNPKGEVRGFPVSATPNPSSWNGYRLFDGRLSATPQTTKPATMGGPEG